MKGKEADTMKIRHPALLKAGGFAAAMVIRTLVGSLRFRIRFLDPTCDPHLPGQARRFVYAFWHEDLLVPAYRYGWTPTKVLISQHADGELIAQTTRHLGLGVVRGSSTRGGVQALRELLALKEGAHHVVVTPDGPRGPQQQVQPGLTFLASRTGLPLVPCGFGYRSAWRLKSWDRFAVPVPFSPVVAVIGEPIHLAPDLKRDALERERVRIEQAMHQTTRLAEEWAAREEW
jgi:lysophospholipid acyltransferase (LPLAT)-like uncharacterized protein